MYLAIKWLMFLGFVMWALLCYIDVHLNQIYNKGPAPKPTVPKGSSFKEKLRFGNNQKQSMVFLNYVTFIAGALAVTLYNKKSEIFFLVRKTLLKMNLRANLENFVAHLKITAIGFRVTLQKIINACWEKIKNILSSSKISFSLLNEEEHRKERNLLLLKRLREVGLERNKLGQLLVVAVRENKNMRLQYHLENLAKKRLMQQIQDTQNQIKESRSKYVNFQQMHLMTHQENLYLKNCIKRLTKDKEEAESNLMKMVGRVYQSTDNNLKAYCTCFIVKTKENMLVGDAQVDISSFLRYLSPDTSGPNSAHKKEEDEDKTKSLPSTSTSTTSQETVLSVVPDEPRPKLKGLPGEYVWTIKDKDGIIEKLYEYDYGYNFDNGDKIRRIREYSVYHDSDCLLDIANSRSSTTIFRDRNNPRPSTLNVPQRNFLTESPVFQQFMKTNSNFSIARKMPAPAPPLVFV